VDSRAARVRLPGPFIHKKKFMVLARDQAMSLPCENFSHATMDYGLEFLSEVLLRTTGYKNRVEERRRWPSKPPNRLLYRDPKNRLTSCCWKLFWYGLFGRHSA
jgi:hypothetical protein